MHSQISHYTVIISTVESMRGAWVVGGPFWLKSCRNEGSNQPTVIDGRQDLVEPTTGTTSASSSKHSASRTIISEISIQDIVSTYRKTAASDLHLQNYQRPLVSDTVQTWKHVECLSYT